MERSFKHRLGSWEIAFVGNVHMYCHSLKATKGRHTVDIPCEDQPIPGSFVGVWLYNAEASDAHKQELKDVLLEWADLAGLRCNIYTDKTNYCSNVAGA